MEVSVIQTFDEFQELRADWERLVEPTLFQQYAWVEAWWRAFAGEPQELHVLKVSNDGQVIAILPLYCETTVKFGRTLAFLGSGKACGDYLDLLVDSQFVEPACAALARWLTGPRRTYAWDTMSLEGVRIGESNAELLAHLIERNGCGVDLRRIESAWHLALPNSWQSYLESLSKRTRRTLRKLDREYIQTNRVTMDVIRDSDGISKSLPTLIDMHESRRKQLKETGCFSVSGFKPFVEDLLRLQDTQLLEIRLLKFGDEPIAANLGYVIDSCFYIYQCGFFPVYAHHKPGWILNVMTIQEGINGGFTTIDFSRGNEVYKKSLGASPTSLGRLEISAPTSAAMLRRSLRLTGSSLKRWWEE